MLSNYVKINSTTQFNSPASGTIQRSNNKSFFLSFHHRSQLADELFTDDPVYKKNKVIVLQMLLIHNDYIIAEIVSVENFGE